MNRILPGVLTNFRDYVIFFYIHDRVISGSIYSLNYYYWNNVFDSQFTSKCVDPEEVQLA